MVSRNASIFQHSVQDLDFDGSVGDDQMYLEDDAQDSSSKRSKKVKKGRTSKRRASNGGALENLMSEPVHRTSTSKKEFKLKSPSKEESGSAWDRLRNKFHKNKDEVSSPRLAKTMTSEEYKKMSSSDHAINYRRAGRAGSPRAGRNKARESGLAKSDHGTLKNASPKSISMDGTIQRDGGGSVRSRRSSSKGASKAPKLLALPAPGDDEPKSPRRSKGRKLKLAEQQSAPNLMEGADRVRRKGSKKPPVTSMTPAPRRAKPMVELMDDARFSLGNDNGSRRSSKSKKKNRSSSIIEEEVNARALIPFIPVPFGDDESLSKSSRKKSSRPGREASRQGHTSPKRKNSKVRLGTRADMERKAGYENEIDDLQKTIHKLKEEKYEEETEASRHMQDLKRRALDTKLELQRSQLENREIKSQLRDKTNHLKEADDEIDELEKLLKEKSNEVKVMEDEIARANEQLAANNTSRRSLDTEDLKSFDSGDDVKDDKQKVEMERSLRQKDSKISALERELEKMKNELRSHGPSSVDDAYVIQRDFKKNKAELEALKTKYEASQERNIMLTADVQHWKNLVFSLEDQLAESKIQENYWTAKYEDIVGVSDSAKAHLTTGSAERQSFGRSNLYGRSNSVNNLAMLNSLDSSRREEQDIDPPASPTASIGGLWAKLTTPSATSKRGVGDRLARANLSNTAH